MRKVVQSWLLGVGLWGLVVSAWPQPTEADLQIHVTGFAHDRGQVIASLFSDGHDVFGKPDRRVVGTIQQNQATLIFPHLPYGSYAMTVFHDENSNNDLDHNFLHLPAEPLGFSNGFKLSLFSGMPSFEKLSFVFAADTKPVEITVK
ncbi:MAG: DUF2141 domain-containing protein [Gammaproteobacteria bacterium]|nr:DUF2141 domain-containing protein [Gammaproteobacteria bacterium]